MSWKKKDKELTPEEAVELAISETSKFWLRSEPLFIANQVGDAFSLHPLKSDFEKRFWILFLFDPTQISYLWVKTFTEEWNQRYRSFDVGIVLVCASKLQPFSEKTFVDDFTEEHKMRFPVVLDHNGYIGRAFGATSQPQVVLIKGQELLFQGLPGDWTPGLESQLQTALRREDRGLALWPYYTPTERLPDPNFFRTIPLNAASKKEGIFLELNDSWVKDGNPFTNLDIREGKIGLYGKWDFHDDSMTPLEDHCRIYLVTQSTHLALLGRSLSKMIEPARAILEINDRPVFETFAESDLKFDDEGFSGLPLKEAKLYRGLKDLDEKSRNISLAFPNAKRIPGALNEIQLFKMTEGP